MGQKSVTYFLNGPILEIVGITAKRHEVIVLSSMTIDLWYDVTHQIASDLLQQEADGGEERLLLPDDDQLVDALSEQKKIFRRSTDGFN